MDRRGQIPNMTSITERPTEIAIRTVTGYWEGDLLKGARNGSVVNTLAERTMRLVLLAKMEGTDGESAYQGFRKKLRQVPVSLRHALTYNPGKEMAEHERFAHRPSIQVFFAAPPARGNVGLTKIPTGCCHMECTDCRGLHIKYCDCGRFGIAVPSSRPRYQCKMYLGPPRRSRPCRPYRPRPFGPASQISALLLEILVALISNWTFSSEKPEGLVMSQGLGMAIRHSISRHQQRPAGRYWGS
jgi:hypothetical protein